MIDILLPILQFIGWIALGWFEIPRKERVGEVLIPPTKKIKLGRFIMWALIPLLKWMGNFKKDILFCILLLLFFILALGFAYVDAKEKVKAAKSIGVQWDPKIIQAYEDRKENSIYFAVVGIGFFIVSCAFVLFNKVMEQMI